jgi:hypothetical protein
MLVDATGESKASINKPELANQHKICVSHTLILLARRVDILWIV